MMTTTTAKDHLPTTTNLLAARRINRNHIEKEKVFTTEPMHGGGGAKTPWRSKPKKMSNSEAEIRDWTLEVTSAEREQVASDFV